MARSVDRYKLNTRKAIFADVVRAQDTVEPALYVRGLLCAARERVREHYDVTPDAMDRIIIEGLEKQWPPLERDDGALPDGQPIPGASRLLG